MPNPPVEKAKCPHCGQDVIKGAYKCQKCGKPLVQIKPPAIDTKAELIACPNCGAQVHKGVYKCPACKNVLLSTASAVAAAAKPKSICPHCGKEILRGSSKCPSCGKTISAVHHPVAASAEPKTEATAGQAAAAPPVDDRHCPKCGKEAPAGKTFCPFCGTKLPRPAQAVTAPEPDLDLPEPIPLIVLYLALGSVVTALLAGVVNLLAHSVWIAAIPAAISIGLGVYALIKNKAHGPALVKILSGLGLITAISGLISPRITLPCAILAGACLGFFWLYGFLNVKFGKRTAMSIIAVCGFAFLLVFGYFVESIAGFFLKQPSSEEARWNLVEFSRAETIYYSHNRAFATNFDDMGYELLKKQHYAYFLDPKKSYQPKDQIFELPPKIDPYISDSGYKFCAVGNLDEDPKLDVWCIEPGMPPEHAINDSTKEEKEETK